VLDLRFVRENPERVKEGAARKRIDAAALVDRLLALDAEHRSLLQRSEGIRAGQKRAGREIASAKDEGLRGRLLAEQARAKQEGKELEARLGVLEEEIREALLRIPQPPAPEVPDGGGEAENVEVRRVGEPPRFDFPARDHVALGEALGGVDLERGARLAGSRNYLLLGPVARLEEAVFRFAYDRMLAKGFVPVAVPVLVNDAAMVGTGYYPGGEAQAYRVASDSLSLVGTAEVPLTAIHAGEILEEEELPKRWIAQSPCFRREAGAAGRETRGLYRVHQFRKIEQVVVCAADPAESERWHRAILENAEEILRALELPYRVVAVCAGDLGAGQVSKFDVETWMPSRGGYGETHSASRFHDFQARRLNLRYRGGDGKVRFVHTLNNTVVASPRILIALLENHQRADGSIHVPAPLRAAMGGLELLEPLRAPARGGAAAPAT
jgi:seryl-tRNA synthetase